MELLLYGITGFLAGIFGGLLGIGGSVIIIPALLVYLSYTPGGYHGSVQHKLQAAAMIVNLFVAAPSAVAHYQARAIVKAVVAPLIPAAVLATLAGVAVSNSRLFARENGAYLAMLFAGFLVYVAVYNTWRFLDNSDQRQQLDEAFRPARWKVVVVGVVMGFTAGILGIGGGAVAVPMLQIMLGLPLRIAVANSAVTIVCIAPIGALQKNLTLAQHGFAVAESLKLAAALIPTAMLGSYLGGRLTHILPRRVLRLVFVAFMATIAYLTFSKAWAALGR